MAELGTFASVVEKPIPFFIYCIFAYQQVAYEGYKLDNSLQVAAPYRPVQ
jgi:hypothetical protein